MFSYYPIYLFYIYFFFLGRVQVSIGALKVPAFTAYWPSPGKSPEFQRIKALTFIRDVSIPPWSIHGNVFRRLFAVSAFYLFFIFFIFFSSCECCRRVKGRLGRARVPFPLKIVIINVFRALSTGSIRIRRARERTLDKWRTWTARQCECIYWPKSEWLNLPGFVCHLEIRPGHVCRFFTWGRLWFSLRIGKFSRSGARNYNTRTCTVASFNFAGINIDSVVWILILSATGSAYKLTSGFYDRISDNHTNALVKSIGDCNEMFSPFRCEHRLAKRNLL